MKRIFAAVVAFNVYSFVFVSAFSAATPYLFHAKEVHDLRKHGLPLRFEDWGFDEHYIWRFIAAVVSTALAGFISGAVARDDTGKTVAWSNAPSVIGWVFYAGLFFFFFAGSEVEPPKNVAALSLGWGIVSVTAIPTTTWVAFHFGRLGAAYQAERFADESILGVAPYHWLWFPLVLSVYGFRIVHMVALLVILQLKTWFNTGLIAGLISLLGIFAVAAWFAPLIFVYAILSRDTLEDKSATYRAVAVICILLAGFLIAHGIQMAAGWVFEKFGI